MVTFTPVLWRPLLVGVDEVMLSMDWTEWHRRGQVVNVLSVAIVLDGITCPLYWIVLSRPGATGLQHWQQSSLQQLMHYDVPIGSSGIH